MSDSKQHRSHWVRRWLGGLFFMACGMAVLFWGISRTSVEHRLITFTHADGSSTSTFRVEVARTPQEMAKGLMYRSKLEGAEGMIFLYPDESEHIFWMKNTLISLDMIFVGADNIVRGVLGRVPPENEEQRTIGKPSQTVVELRGGVAAAEGIQVGDRLVIE